MIPWVAWKYPRQQKTGMLVNRCQPGGDIMFFVQESGRTWTCEMKKTSLCSTYPMLPVLFFQLLKSSVHLAGWRKTTDGRRAFTIACSGQSVVGRRSHWLLSLGYQCPADAIQPLQSERILCCWRRQCKLGTWEASISLSSVSSLWSAINAGFCFLCFDFFFSPLSLTNLGCLQMTLAVPSHYWALPISFMYPRIFFMLGVFNLGVSAFLIKYWVYLGSQKVTGWSFRHCLTPKIIDYFKNKMYLLSLSIIAENSFCLQKSADALTNV